MFFKVVQQQTSGAVGKLIRILLKI